MEILPIASLSRLVSSGRGVGGEARRGSRIRILGEGDAKYRKRPLMDWNGGDCFFFCGLCLCLCLYLATPPSIFRAQLIYRIPRYGFDLTDES